MKHQRLIAAICIAILSVIYLVGYIEWKRIVSAPERSIVAARAADLAPPFTPEELRYAPDITPPSASEGLAPTLYSVNTQHPVVFLTIDDGLYREPEAAAKMREANIQASLFLTQQYVSQSPDYFASIARETDSTIQNHTLSHRDLPQLSYEDQKHEICQTSDNYAATYGKRPDLFRPPYGDYDANTRRAAADCGMKAVILWSATVDGGQMHYQVGDRLRPGDIVLMHFRPLFQHDLAAFVAASKQAGLQPQLLEDWITPGN